MNILDSHLHVWDLRHSDYAWLSPEHGALHRSFLPEEAGEELAAAAVSAAVLVQAEDSERDTRFLLDTAAAHAWVHGVVGWIQLDDLDQARRQLDEYDVPALRGIRHLVHDDPRADFLALDAVHQSLSLVASRGLAFDVPDAWPAHLEAVGRLADLLPELTVVVDHLAKPPRGTADLSAWEQALRSVAQRPNVVAKLSGLQMPDQPYSAAALRPVADVAFDAFGPERLMFGSDWPMTTDVGGYPATVSVTGQLVAQLTDDEREAIWAGTAHRTYGRAA